MLRSRFSKVFASSCHCVVNRVTVAADNPDPEPLWVDGIHLKVQLEQEKLCLLVMIGVRADGRKELVALTDG